jgi:hypothetical protein
MTIKVDRWSTIKEVPVKRTLGFKPIKTVLSWPVLKTTLADYNGLWLRDVAEVFVQTGRAA